MKDIDSVLKKECVFCGPILIDMIDNEIDATEKESEFADKKKKRSYNVDKKGKAPAPTTMLGVDDVWDIK